MSMHKTFQNTIQLFNLSKKNCNASVQVVILEEKVARLQFLFPDRFQVYDVIL